MNKFFIFILFVCFAFGSSKETLSQLIAEMKRADVKERYIYMNKIKMKLREMNEEKRAEIIEEFKKEFGKRKNVSKIKNKKIIREHFNDIKLLHPPMKGRHGKH